MTPYYKECFEKGLEYQDFVADMLADKYSILLTSYSSERYQLAVGENRQGIEIKFDDQFKNTGNLYIEFAEKRNGDNEKYVDSGIMREDNSWLYLIGDYNNIYIFGINFLKRMYISKKYKEVETPTSKGFLINKETADKWATNIIKIEQEVKAPWED